MMSNNNPLPRIEFVEEASGFVGLRTFEGKLIINIPKSLRLSEDENERRKEFILFLNSINIAKTYEKKKSNKSTNAKVNIWPFESYLWIIQDCMINGYYYDRDKKYFNDNKGKLEWKKILKNTPIVSEGNIIYDQLITSRAVPTNNEIANIYRYCLKIANERIGWLFNYSFDTQQSKIMSNNQMKYIINKELTNTFDDVKRLRFKHLLAILNEMGDDETSSSLLYGITNYYYVFERMIDEYLNGISENEKKKFNPKGYWNLNSMGEIEASNLRPDTVTEYDNKIFIIDSKMYKFGHTGNPNDLPETTSMQKQITYADYVNLVLEGKKEIRNIFIIPFDKELNVFNKVFVEYIDDDHNLAYIGYARTNWRDNSNFRSYENIHTFLIDLNHLLKKYKTNERIVELIEYVVNAE